MPQPARSDEELVRGITAGEVWAAAALLDQYGPMVERLLRRVFGHDPELEDLVHDAFATILGAIHQVRDAQALKGWIATVSVNTAHRALRRRRMARMLFFWRHDEDTPEPVSEPGHGPREAVRRMYAALEQLPAAERVPFALRYIDEMPLEDVARACSVSLATVKRRLGRAERRFTTVARRDPVLQTWMEERSRWTTK
jgi:RNA polymerase sigma-70 factor (ECF subfamily)